mmetsp:Transcript_5640/g.8466  ORF Transcript_5640/g.8466 Transcript_5640/m.8466 type:complete len:438 (-) Transcript_5640:6-1319(-)
MPFFSSLVGKRKARSSQDSVGSQPRTSNDSMAGFPSDLACDIRATPYDCSSFIFAPPQDAEENVDVDFDVDMLDANCQPSPPPSPPAQNVVPPWVGGFQLPAGPAVSLDDLAEAVGVDERDEAAALRAFPPASPWDGSQFSGASTLHDVIEESASVASGSLCSSVTGSNAADIPGASGCDCRVCRAPEASHLRHCTKGHRFEWLSLCSLHPMREKCTHVNKCSVCRANRGYCVLEAIGLTLDGVPSTPVPRLHEGVPEGKGVTWKERNTTDRLESKRTGNGQKRPYQTNAVRVSNFLSAEEVLADPIVVIGGQIHLIKAVWSNGRMQAPIARDVCGPGALDFRLTINPAEFRSMQPHPLNPSTQRLKGIGWASVLFYVQTPYTRLQPLWLWMDLPVVSDKFEKGEVQKRMPSGVKSLQHIKDHARSLDARKRANTAQ